MSKIEYKDIGAKSLIYDYKGILQKKINEVCLKIGFNDSDVNWYIFDPSKGKNIIEFALVGEQGKDYGYCLPRKKEIYISVLAIEAQLEKSNSLLAVDRNSDFLADVILDEITHIQTAKDHDDAEYKNKLRKNNENFCYTLSERVLAKVQSNVKGNR